MNALERNLCGVIAEMAMKLDIRDMPLSLNYPLKSLNGLMGTALDMQGMRRALDVFGAEHEREYGRLLVSEHEEGFCLTVPAEGVAHMRGHAPSAAFLCDLLNAVKHPGTTVERLIGVFERHGGHVHAERVENDEFDWLVYFEDGIPDDFRYCIDAHDGHISYHRFSKADYDAFEF